MKMPLSDVRPIAKTGVSFISDPPVAVLKRSAKETPLAILLFRAQFIWIFVEQKPKWAFLENVTCVFHHKMTSREVQKEQKRELSDGESITRELTSTGEL